MLSMDTIYVLYMLSSFPVVGHRRTPFIGTKKTKIVRKSQEERATEENNIRKLKLEAHLALPFRNYGKPVFDNFRSSGKKIKVSNKKRKGLDSTDC